MGMNKLIALIVLAFTLAACGASAPEETDAPGFECGRAYTGLYGAHTYGIDNELVAKCQALGGACTSAEPSVCEPGATAAR